MAPAPPSKYPAPNVALPGGRVIDPSTGASSVVGNTVDVHTARYTNRIGAAQLSALWIDKDFKAEQTAFYYARVLEIPTPRWSTRPSASSRSKQDTSRIELPTALRARKTP